MQVPAADADVPLAFVFSEDVARFALQAPRPESFRAVNLGSPEQLPLADVLPSLATHDTSTNEGGRSAHSTWCSTCCCTCCCV